MGLFTYRALATAAASVSTPGLVVHKMMEQKLRSDIAFASVDGLPLRACRPWPPLFYRRGISIPPHRPGLSAMTISCFTLLFMFSPSAHSDQLVLRPRQRELQVRPCWDERVHVSFRGGVMSAGFQPSMSPPCPSPPSTVKATRLRAIIGFQDQLKQSRAGTTRSR